MVRRETPTRLRRQLQEEPLFPHDREWTVAELAYFAGILDGEGCLSITSGKRRSTSTALTRSTQIYVGNTDPRIIEWIQARFGGSIALRPTPHPERHKPLWRWLCSGANIEPVLRAVLPYLIIKREQATVILAYRKTMAMVGSNVPTMDDTQKAQDDMIAQLRVLNKRGVA